MFHCVHHKRRGCKTTTSLDAVYEFISGTIGCVTFISNFKDPKRGFSASFQVSISEKLLFDQFEVIFFQRKNIFFKPWWLFVVSTAKEN